MTRLSRSESQARTRAALLGAAREVLVETGVGAATVDRIAERAGFSKGAVYSNFESRESIVLALLEQHLDAEVASLRTLLADPATLDDLLERVRAFYATLHRDPGLVLLSIEFQLLAVRDAEVRAAYLKLWRHHRAALAALLQETAVRLGVTLKSRPDHLVDTLAALTRGLALQAAVNGTRGARPVQDVLIQFLRSEIAPSR